MIAVPDECFVSWLKIRRALTLLVALFASAMLYSLQREKKKFSTPLATWLAWCFWLLSESFTQTAFFSQCTCPSTVTEPASWNMYDGMVLLAHGVLIALCFRCTLDTLTHPAKVADTTAFKKLYLYLALFLLWLVIAPRPVLCHPAVRWLGATANTSLFFLYTYYVATKTVSLGFGAPLHLLHTLWILYIPSWSWLAALLYAVLLGIQILLYEKKRGLSVPLTTHC
jgi:hypothetical protein